MRLARSRQDWPPSKDSSGFSGAEIIFLASANLIATSNVLLRIFIASVDEPHWDNNPWHCRENSHVGRAAIDAAVSQQQWAATSHKCGNGQYRSHPAGPAPTDCPPPITPIPGTAPPVRCTTSADYMGDLHTICR